jgi:hypothetical protein
MSDHTRSGLRDLAVLECGRRAWVTYYQIWITGFGGVGGRPTDVGSRITRSGLRDLAVLEGGRRAWGHVSADLDYGIWRCWSAGDGRGVTYYQIWITGFGGVGGRVGSVVCRQLLCGLLGCSQLCVKSWSAVGCVQSVGVQSAGV